METLLMRLARERKLSFAEIARQAVPETSQQQVERLAKGQRTLDLQWGRRLEPALGVAPQDLYEGRIRRVRLELAVARSPEETPSHRFDLPPEAGEWIEAPSDLTNKEQCFAARVDDGSAERVYPKGSILFVRRLAFLDGVLHPGDKVVARFRDIFGTTVAVLAGRISESPTGDLVLFTMARGTALPESLLLRPRAAPDGLPERFLPYRFPADAIDYVPRPGDAGEVLGIIEYATTPER